MKPDTLRKKKCPNRHTHPSVSCGTKDKKLLRHILNLGKERLNIKAYSRENNIPRSSIYDMLKRLINKQLVEKKNEGNFIITEQGKTYTNITNGGVGTPRRECRESGNLSIHYLRFTLPIKDKSKFIESRIKELNPIDNKQLILDNLKQHYIYFNDATIIINPKVIYIRIHDIRGEETEETLLRGFNKAIYYAKKIDKLGIVYDTIELKPAHYARLNSLLGDFLKKIDKRYFLDLEKGRKLWIDYSDTGLPGGEEETNSKDVRERTDNFMRDMLESESLVSDLDKMKELWGKVSEIEAMRMRQRLEPQTELDPPNYFG